MSPLRAILFSIAALLAGVGVVTVVSSNTLLSLLTQAVVYAVFALGIGVLLKHNGLVSFGHALYFGVAGYAIGITLQQQIMPVEWAILATLAGVGIAAFVVGLIIVRVPGIAFGMLTLAIGQMFFFVCLTRTWHHGWR